MLNRRYAPNLISEIKFNDVLMPKIYISTSKIKYSKLSCFNVSKGCHLKLSLIFVPVCRYMYFVKMLTVDKIDTSKVIIQYNITDCRALNNTVQFSWRVTFSRIALSKQNCILKPFFFKTNIIYIWLNAPEFTHTLI